jgi:protein ImuB
MRLACLFVPLFPLAARLRSEPALKGEAAAVFEGNGNAARVVAATRKARQAGIEAGMSLPQARSIYPRLLARPRDLASERAAQEVLLEIAETFSPRVEDAGDGVVYLALDGLPTLLPLPPVPPCHPFASSPCHPEHSEGSALSRRSDAFPLRAGSEERSDEGSAPVRSSIVNHQSTIANSSGSTLTASSINHQSLEHSLARDILSAAEKASLPARAGVASSKLAARVAAGLPDTPVVVPEGKEGRFLGPLPLSRLSPAVEIAETLDRWGIRSIGNFARLPEGEVASRLGELGRELHAAARGIDLRPLEPRLPPPDFAEGMDLEWPLVSLEPFLFVGNAALERLVARLESQGLACVRLEVSLRLDPDGCDVRAVALPAPTREVKTLLTLVRLELEARPPGAPVCGFTFTAHPDRPRRSQLSLFGPAALSPDRLATTIARLAALLGADRIGSPRAVDGHRPERFTQTGYAPPPPPSLARPPKTGRGLLAIRVLRPPIPLEVLVDGCHPFAPFPCHPEERSDEGSAPAVPSITNHKSQITNSPDRQRPLSVRTVAPDTQPSISGDIKVASGPWSMEEGWWSSDPADRDYWDVELSDGALYRIYRDRQSNAWFADGVYD